MHILTGKVQDSVSKPTANPVMDEIINNTNLSNSLSRQETELTTILPSSYIPSRHAVPSKQISNVNELRTDVQLQHSVSNRLMQLEGAAAQDYTAGATGTLHSSKSVRLRGDRVGGNVAYTSI